MAVQAEPQRVRRAPSAPAGSLPAELSSFVGRQDELLGATQALAGTRLLTLAGPGGVGKTRLAARVAREVGGSYPDGVWFVALAQLPAGSEIAPPILRALGASDDAPDAVAALEARLAGRELLLVLDNCEHVQAQTVALTTRLLRSTEALTVLTTSRHVLGAEGERVTVVRPLRTAPSGNGRSEAAELFHARAVAAGAKLDAAAADQVETVCRRLDGMPLALELAAVRLRWIPLDELVRHLDDIVPLLGPVGSFTARQEALEATLSWSHDLCDEYEKRAWRLLSVFHGPFDVDAAQAVLAGSRTDVVQQIGRLLDKSVVLRGQGEGPPYMLLETVRQYGRQMLRDDPAEREAVLRHRRHYLALAARGSTDYFGPRDLAWFTAVSASRSDLRIALVDGLDDPETWAVAAHGVVELRPYWAHTGSTREGMELVRHALAVAPAEDDVTGRLLVAGGQLAALLGLTGEAHALLDKAEASPLTPLVAAELLEHQALLALLEGHAAEAFETALDAAERLARHGAPGAVPDALLVACTAGLETGDARVPDLSARNLAMTRQAGSRLTRATVCWVAGVLNWRAGDLEAAHATLDEGLHLFRLFEQSTFVGMTLETKACLNAADGRLRLAARLFGACEALWSTSPAFPHRISDRLSWQARAEVREALGPACYESLRAEGATFSKSDAISAALGYEDAATPSQARAMPSVTVSPLTARESEVAQLIAEGLSNRSIAEHLVIAPRTAEAHVEHIRTKLGFHSRAQIAAWVARGTGSDREVSGADPA